MRERRPRRFGGWEQLRGRGAGDLLRIRHHRIFQNAVALYAAQFVGYVLPLISIPYLARTLGPASLGLVAFAQVIGTYVQLVIEYGFRLSATREVSRYRDSSDRLAEILAGVTGARVILCLGCLSIIGLAQLLIPSLRDDGPFLWMAVLWGMAYALRPLWFFLGLERVRLITAVDILAAGVATVGIFVFVHGPDDALTVLILQAGGATLSTAIATILAYRQVAFRLPKVSDVWNALRLGWSVFVYRSAGDLYSRSNVFILGFLAPAQIIGFYAGAEKINRTAMSLMYPISTALYPHTSRLAYQEQNGLARIVRTYTLIMGLGGVLVAAAAYPLTPLVLPIILGPGYGASIPIFQILALLFPITWMSIPLEIQWMIPLGLEDVLIKLTFAAGVAHFILTIGMISQFGAIGAAWAFVISQLCFLAAIWIFLNRRKLNPFDHHHALSSLSAAATGNTQDTD
ncbi:flippase [Nitrolancea hollandica]|uniref:Putative Polysaccharide biosynthesis protein n=1 Tax=Nitrolancea hollandica Lb TaxID=1129897 RepID=I4EHZ3_9BACT|nr:flippase [Nitrolancea hollandica]CCF84305.1 putative Polysaccharide biosynthesis protein [Nitrolancea hollandica Lb]